MMENEFYEDEFEQLLKEKADQFSMYPSKRVWHSIYNNLHPSRRWPSVVMSLLLIGSLILIGYLNTGENSITKQINNNTSGYTSYEKNNEITASQKKEGKQPVTALSGSYQKPEQIYNDAFKDVISTETDLYSYTVVKSNRPVPYTNAAPATEVKQSPDEVDNNDQNIIQTIDTYIKSNQIFADIALNNKKEKNNAVKTADKTTSVDLNTEQGSSLADVNSVTKQDITQAPASKSTDNTPATGLNESTGSIAKKQVTAKEAVDKNGLTNDEKAWIENYALQNKTAAKKWKGRLGYQVYVTPAVNYRKLTTNSKGSATAFANADINNSISQKPGFGFETGVGLNYSVTKRIQLKAGVQFNYTNYNIAADETNHPIATTILLNDPSTGYSYSAARMSTTSNSFNTTPLQPVTLHNRTYQVSLPVGFAYRISSQNNVDWYAGASVQPSYIFDGNAHIISSDLKSYVSDRSSISPWNLNLGFETYMNFKLGAYNLQVGPQVRYQVNSTYKRDVALIEKPYAVGLKLGLTKGF
jgi:hypothetical protein